MPQSTDVGKPKFQIDLNIEAAKGLRQSSNEELSSAMEPEIERFQAWFTEQGNAGLVRLERSILKTYLAWKLLYEDGCPASQD